MNKFEIKHAEIASLNDQTLVASTNNLSQYLSEFLSELDIKNNSKGASATEPNDYVNEAINSIQKMDIK